MAEPDGKVFPLSNHANSVLDVLRFALDRENIELRTGSRVSSLKRRGNQFLVGTDGGDLDANYVIVACGGAAGARLGGVMDGYQLLGMMGHSRTNLYPSLVQIKTDPTYPRALKGVKADAARCCRHGQYVDRQPGACCYTWRSAFAEYGLSGPAIFEVYAPSALAVKAFAIRLDLLADLAEEEITALLTRRF